MKFKNLAIGASLAVLAAATALPQPVAAQDTHRWKMANMFGSNFNPIGKHIEAMTEKVELATGDTVKIRSYEPNALVPVLGIWDAVSAGSVDAGYVGIGIYLSKEPGVALLNASPFMPDLAEFMAWIYNGGGQEVLNEVLAEHNMYGIVCGVLSPEGGGWFNKKVDKIEDFNGLKMRIGGLGANVLEGIGVSTQALAGGEVYQALERGVIDSAEFSNPPMDLSIGLYEIAQYYYFPGWQNPTSPEWLVINLDAYNALSDDQKAGLDMACGDTVIRSIAEGETLSAKAMQELRDKDVEVRRWSPEVIAELKRLWIEEANRLSAEDPNFKKIWDSMTTFREQYAEWRDLQHIAD